MPPPSPARLQALAKVSCNIFSTTFNPTASRNGNKILRQRLRGPALLDYYPTENVKLQTVIRAFPELGLLDEAEEIRKADVDARKRRTMILHLRCVVKLICDYRRQGTTTKRTGQDEGEEEEVVCLVFWVLNNSNLHPADLAETVFYS